MAVPGPSLALGAAITRGSNFFAVKTLTGVTRPALAPPPAYRARMDPTQRPDGLDHPIVPKLMRLMSRANVWLYRRTGGRVGGTWRVGSAFPRGIPMLLLTTTGRKTSAPRTTPLLYITRGDTFVVVASQGGLRKNPQWYFNLLAKPEVDVQVGAKVMPLRARVATPEERAELWPRLVAHYADFATYQAWTDREIPVVLLEPAPASA